MELQHPLIALHMASRHKTKSTRRGWWRSEFYDCPTNPTNELYNIFGTSLKTGKTKVACKLCFDDAFAALLRNEEENVRNGVQDFVRNEDYIKDLSKSLFYFIKFIIFLLRQIFDNDEIVLASSVVINRCRFSCNQFCFNDDDHSPP